MSTTYHLLGMFYIRYLIPRNCLKFICIITPNFGKKIKAQINNPTKGTPSLSDRTGIQEDYLNTKTMPF